MICHRVGKDDLGVSPVIAVILLVAVTVTLSAVIGGFALNLGQQSTGSGSTPSEAVSVSSSGDGNYTVSLITEPSADYILVHPTDEPNNNTTIDSVGEQATIQLGANESLSVIAVTDGERRLITTESADSGATTTATVSGPAMFDNFETTTVSGDYSGDVGNWSTTTTRSNGTGNTSLTPTDTFPGAIYNTSATIERGHSYTVDFYINTNTGSAQKYHDLHFLFARQDGNNTYDCVLNDGGQDWKLKKIENGNGTILDSGSVSVVNTWSQMNVTMYSNGTISCSVAGKTLRATDSTFDSGHYGFFLSGSGTEHFWDNVQRVE